MGGKGKLVSWHEGKAFGFILPFDGSTQIFIHKSVFSNKTRIPQVNDIITYSISTDKQGRLCAAEATFSGEKLVVLAKPSMAYGPTFLLGRVSFVRGVLPIT